MGSRCSRRNQNNDIIEKPSPKQAKEMPNSSQLPTRISEKNLGINKVTIAILGETGVGKTCLVESFINKKTFEPDNTSRRTNQIDQTSKIVKMRDGNRVNVEINDLAGNATA